MQQGDNENKYDVVIIGAGPAGCAAALALKDSGLRVALLDKTTFPRDKVCGDAIPGRAIKTLKSIDPTYEAVFKAFPKKFETRKTALYYKGRSLTFDWVQEAYTCARIDFDNFLFSLVKQTNTTILTDTLPNKITVGNDGVKIILKNTDTTLTTQIVIGADGAHSAVAKALAPKTLNRDHHVGSVRAYYSNVTGLDDVTTHIYFERKFLPSYLWAFPLPGHKANIGFGMLSSEIVKRKVNLKTSFYEFIAQTPAIKDVVAQAQQAGPLEGFGLPLGSNIETISGDRFMLVGDAASLIDPISGDGIGNAMLSGKLAAEQAIHCLQQNNFTAACMKAYDNKLLSRIGAELNTHYKAQRILGRFPILLDIIFLAGRNRVLKKLIQKGL